jgi:hypothetical protein
MKARLTNSYIEFVKHVEEELSTPQSANSRVFFSAFPSLGCGHFSIELVEEDCPFLLVKQWDQDLGESYHLGIYNLNNVKITEKKVSLSDKDFLIIQELVNTDIIVEILKKIVLDGADLKLRINRQDKIEEFLWRTDEQISNVALALIKKFVNLADIKVK